jgi:hypothetical protein
MNLFVLHSILQLALVHYVRDLECACEILFAGLIVSRLKPTDFRIMTQIECSGDLDQCQNWPRFHA